MGLPRRQHVVIGIRPLHDPPHSIHVVSCMPPIALGVQVAEVEAVLQAELDGCNGSRDLTGHEGFAADRTFVVEQRSEEHTSELQSLMRISYAVFCLKKKKNKAKRTT